MTWIIGKSLRFSEFFYSFEVFSVDYYGIHQNDSHWLDEDFIVTSSGQLFIRRVIPEMRFFTFKCSVMEKTTYQWSEPLLLQPLTILMYRKYIH